jgi:putative redox protein
MKSPTVTVQVDWSQGYRFGVESGSGARADFDGDKKAGLSPMENLLASLATCMGSDVVMILQRMKTDLRGMKIEITGERNPEPPKFYRKIDFAFTVTGKIPPEKVERAISLSFDKYCSVFHTLRKDLVVDHKLAILEG